MRAAATDILRQPDDATMMLRQLDTDSIDGERTGPSTGLNAFVWTIGLLLLVVAFVNGSVFSELDGAESADAELVAGQALDESGPSPDHHWTGTPYGATADLPVSSVSVIRDEQCPDTAEWSNASILLHVAPKHSPPGPSRG